MPATFPSHPAAVLPLKLWRPRWFDGVALVVGAGAPDAAYPVVGLVSLPETHTWFGLLWFSLPVAYVGCLIIRGLAPVVAAHLPDFGALHLRDYGVLGLVRHRWYVTVVVHPGGRRVPPGLGRVHPPAGRHQQLGGPGGRRARRGRARGGCRGGTWCNTSRRSSVRPGRRPWPGTSGEHRPCGGGTGHRRRCRCPWSGSGLPPRSSWSRAWRRSVLLPRAASAHVSGARLLYAVALALIAGALASGIRRSRHRHRSSTMVG